MNSNFFLIYFIMIIALFIIVYICKGIVIIKQDEVGIVERLGKNKKIIEAGLHFINPFIDKVRRIIITELLLDVVTQNVTTKDGINISINSQIAYKIIDVQKAAYAVNDLPRSLHYMTSLTIKKMFQDMKYDDICNLKETIKLDLKNALNKEANLYGCLILNIYFDSIINNPKKDDEFISENPFPRN